jgi:hypothetical protein
MYTKLELGTQCRETVRRNAIFGNRSSLPSALPLDAKVPMVRSSFVGNTAPSRFRQRTIHWSEFARVIWHHTVDFMCILGCHEAMFTLRCQEGIQLPPRRANANVPAMTSSQRRSLGENTMFRLGTAAPLPAVVDGYMRQYVG